MKKKLIAFAMASLMAVSLFGCGKKEETQGTTKVSASKDYVYKMEKLDIGEKDDSVDYLVRVGETVYAYGYRWSDGGSGLRIKFFELNNDGTVASQHTLRMGDSVNVNSINMDGEGNLYCIRNFYYPVGEEPDMTVTGGAEAEKEPVKADGEGAGAEDGDADGEGAGDDNAAGDTGVIQPRTADAGEEEDGESEDGGAETEDTADAEDAGTGETEAVADDVSPAAEAAYEESYEDVEYVDDYYLSKISLEGEVIFSVKLNDVPEIAAIGEENGYFYVNNMILDKGKGIYVSVLGRLIKFDLEGNYVAAISAGDGQNPLEGANLSLLDDGRVMATLYEEDGVAFAQADLEKGTIGEKFKLPGRSYDFSFFPGNGYDLYLSNNYGLYGYNLGEADKTQLMSFIDSDFSFSNLYQVVGISDTEFFGVFDDSDSERGSSLARFVKVPPEEVKEKQEFTLAMGNTNWNVRQAAIRFNQSSDTIRIRLVDYNTLYGSDEDYNAGIARLNTDIVSGKMPDIVILDDSMPVDSYISKGLFEDLKPFIEKDEEVPPDSLLSNVIEAYSVDGKLYSLVPSFSVQTVAVKTSDVGDKTGWTVAQAQEILASKPEGTQFLMTVTRGDMTQYCISMSGNQFIDWDSGKCNFNSDEFIQMLEFIKTFPDEIDQAIYTDDFWNNYDTMWREGKVLANVLNLGDFRHYNVTEKGTFGEKITLIGFPASEGNAGSVIWPDLRIALSSKCADKEAAWGFLRTFLSEEYQKNNIYNFPIRADLFNEMADKAMEKPYYEDENGNRIEYDDTYWMNGVDVTIPPMTQEEVNFLKEWIIGVKQPYKMDETLINIISEEAEPFYSGQKNARDVAGIIQSRVQLYVNENR